jgi:hypothetical protein
MLAKYTILLIALLSTSAVASVNGRAEFVPQIFDRTSRPAGGWSLSLNAQEQCPSDAPQCGSSWCCPVALTCVTTGDADIGEACCPGCKSLNYPSYFIYHGRRVGPHLPLRQRLLGIGRADMINSN